MVATSNEPLHGERVHRVGRLQEAVAIMLRFASESAGLRVPEGLVPEVIPLLRSPPEQIDPAGEVVLWQRCDQLSQLIRPVPLEAAKLAIELADWDSVPVEHQARLVAAKRMRSKNMRWLVAIFLFLLIYVLAQGYVIGLGRALDDAKVSRTRLETVSQQKVLVGTNAVAVQSLEEQRTNAEAALTAASEVMRRLVAWAPVTPDALFKASEEAQDGMQPGGKVVDQVSAALRVETYAKVWLDIVQSYVIPLFLGLIGACAYVVRQISQTIKDHSYVAANAIRDSVRIAQGATFGTLAGILTAALDIGDSASQVSIPLMALLCGYNSEIVFRVMDSLILKFRSGTAQENPPAPVRV